MTRKFYNEIFRSYESVRRGKSSCQHIKKKSSRLFEHWSCRFCKTWEQDKEWLVWSFTFCIRINHVICEVTPTPCLSYLELVCSTYIYICLAGWRLGKVCVWVPAEILRLTVSRGSSQAQRKPSTSLYRKYKVSKCFQNISINIF